MTAPISHKRRQVPGPRHLQWALCETTLKRGYFRKRDAKVARSRMTGRPLSVFRCGSCGNFHLGHLPVGVRAGAISRAAYNEAARSRAS